MGKLYFAYGSNLNVEQMAMRCPGADPIKKVRLWGWELEFRRVLTIVQKPGGYVEGGLWSITPEDEQALDRYEGFPGWYDKRTVEVQDEDGETFKAMTYVLEKGKAALPSEQYLQTCVLGCADFDIDPLVMFRAVYKLRGVEAPI